jgi:predicted phosphoribosyltransferase
MRFYDRKDAGRALADALSHYKGDPDAIVLAIPKGGIEVGLEVAKRLGIDFDLIMCRKLQYPWTTESGYGAICEDGSLYINEAALDGVTQEDIYREIERQQKEIAKRIRLLRKGRPIKPLTGKTVILVDDGIAMGSTMQAAIQMIKKHNPKKIVVAVPTASPQAVRHFMQLADEVVALYTPYPFYAVADAYANWYDVSDEEALALLESIQNNEE